MLSRRVVLVTLPVVTAVIAAGLQPVASRADEFDLLFEEFDARPLTEAEKLMLQTGLAFEGDYNGLIDGSWGRRSQTALGAYARRIYATRDFGAGQDRRPQYLHAYLVVSSAIDQIGRLGWRDVHFPKSGLSLAAPWGLLQRTDKPDFWTTSSQDLELQYSTDLSWQVEDTHRKFERYHSVPERPYFVRRDDRMVTSVRFANGGGAYLRSDILENEWVTVFIMAKSKSAYDMMRLISSGIHIGPPRNWTVPNGSLLKRVVALGRRYRPR